MSNLANSHFDDSDDEEDNFNPAPADLSDNEDGQAPVPDYDVGAQVQKEPINRPSRNDASEDGSKSEQVNNKLRGSDGDNDQEDDNEDTEGEGESTALGAEDDDEDDDDEDDDEEITVSFLPYIGCGCDISICSTPRIKF